MEIRKINIIASAIVTERSKVELNMILDIKAFDFSKFDEKAFNSINSQLISHTHHNDDECGHCDHESHSLVAEYSLQKDVSLRNILIEEEGILELKELEQWLADLLWERSTDIFRLKGVLNVKNQERKVVLQGVHKLFDTQEGVLWTPEEDRINKIFFIGRNLDLQQLSVGFKKCVHK